VKDTVMVLFFSMSGDDVVDKLVVGERITGLP
jgi:hypothetical protein